MYEILLSQLDKLAKRLQSAQQKSAASADDFFFPELPSLPAPLKLGGDGKEKSEFDAKVSQKVKPRFSLPTKHARYHVMLAFARS